MTSSKRESYLPFHKNYCIFKCVFKFSFNFVPFGWQYNGDNRHTPKRGLWALWFHASYDEALLRCTLQSTTTET